MTYEQEQEAWRDEQRMLRYSCLTDDEYGRRDIQREKRLDEQIEAAYAEIARDERKARVLFDAINRIANTDTRYGNQMREIAQEAFDEVTQLPTSTESVFLRCSCCGSVWTLFLTM